MFLLEAQVIDYQFPKTLKKFIKITEQFIGQLKIRKMYQGGRTTMIKKKIK